MRKNLKGCKKLARETLAGNFMVPVIGSIAVAAMSVLSSYISTALFPGDSLYAIIGGEVFSFILSLVICVFSAGLYRIYLNISRREAYSFGDLLYFFSHQPDHVIVASFVLALINLVTSLPLAWFSFTSDMGNTVEEQMNWAVTYMLLTLLGFVLNLLVAMPFTMSYYILSDNPDMKGMQKTVLHTAGRRNAGIESQCEAYEGALLGVSENALKFYTVDYFFHVYTLSGTDLAGALYRNLYGSFLSEYFRGV